MAFTIGKNLNLNQSVSRGISQFEFGSSMLGRTAKTKNPVNIVDNLNAIGINVPPSVKKAAGIANDIKSAYDSINRFLGKYSPSKNSALSALDPALQKGKPTVFKDKNGNIIVSKTNSDEKNLMPEIKHNNDGISLKQFLDYFNTHGVAVSNNFQVWFNNRILSEGTETLSEDMLDIGMQLLSIEVPALETGTTDISFDGHKIEIPTVHDYGHTFSMTVMNDADGLAYSKLMNFIRATQRDTRVLSSLKAIIYSSAGSPTENSDYPYVENKYNGQTICLYGVRILGLGGLSFAYSSSDIQTFTIDCYVQYITYGSPIELYTGDVTLGQYNSIAGSDAIEVQTDIAESWVAREVLGAFGIGGDPTNTDAVYMRSDNRWTEFK